jgi:hypothetical protein
MFFKSILGTASCPVMQTSNKNQSYVLRTLAPWLIREYLNLKRLFGESVYAQT